jgi:hypothetical protein
MNKKIMLIAAGVLVVGAVATGLVVRMNNAGATKTAQTQTTATPTPSVAAKTLSYDGVEGKTALELLKTKDSSAVTKGEGTNAYVTTINGYTASDTNKEFWALYVNGKQSEVGAGSYVTKSGDKIEWRIEKY